MILSAHVTSVTLKVSIVPDNEEPEEEGDDLTKEEEDKLMIIKSFEIGDVE